MDWESCAQCVAPCFKFRICGAGAKGRSSMQYSRESGIACLGMMLRFFATCAPYFLNVALTYQRLLVRG